MRTNDEVVSEIAMLKELQLKVGDLKLYGHDTRAQIGAQIAVLEKRMTYGEIVGMPWPNDVRSSAELALEWMHDDIRSDGQKVDQDVKLSEGWKMSISALQLADAPRSLAQAKFVDHIFNPRSLTDPAWEAAFPGPTLPSALGPAPRVLCGLAIDPFGPDTEQAWLDALLALADKHRDLEWILVTRHPENVIQRLEAAPSPGSDDRRNVHLGLHIAADEDVAAGMPVMLQASHRFFSGKVVASIAPLREPVDLSTWMNLYQYEDGSAWCTRNIGIPSSIHLVVASENISDALPGERREWLQLIEEQCVAANVQCLQYRGASLTVAPMAMPSADDVAAEFAAALLVSIGEDHLRTVIQRNEERADSTCASHDFCDANEVMLKAINQLGPWDVDEVIHDARWTTLWDDAWNLAKTEKFRWILGDAPSDSPSPDAS